ncbi:COR domain-containing protein [Paenibacillus sp. FSL P4-0338]|uniref:COR domain-containing protein n=1 Tax=Paenibacillus sp. FSL P4-0338 TaxID=2921635 RepID=UPI0030F962C3
MVVNHTTNEKFELENLIQKIKDPRYKFLTLGIKITDEILSAIIKQAMEEQWEHIRFASAGISSIPKDIGKIKSLKSLSFESYDFFDDEFINSIKVIPEELCELENLEALDVSGCPIISLPSGISKLQKLSSLHLANTKIEMLPEELFRLKNLELLNIVGCPIESLTPQISNLKKLSSLYFHGTKISTFPQEIFGLRELRNLGLSNKIVEIPQEITKLRNLTSIMLIGSELTEIPAYFGSLNKLQELYLHGSKINYFPDSLKNLVNMKKIDIDNTPFVDFIPPEIMKQPAIDVVNYILRYQADPNKLKLNESKMLIVGQGGVGKSSLLQRLVHQNYSEPGEIDSTEGIDIERWCFQVDGHDYKLNVWDFGGQEIYHSTHQFFLTNRSMYILVWDARQEDEYGRIDYWLNTVESFAGESPILLVINKCDERKNIKHVDLKSLQNKFPQIVDAYKVSCSNGMGIDDLEKSIKEEAITLPLTNIVWLSSWIKIRSHLENLASFKHLISYTKYLEICNQYDVKEGEAKSLSQYLHDLGIILHFKEDMLLKDFVILNPDWGTDAVYKVLDAEDDLLQDRNGMLYIDDLPAIWTNREVYPEDKYSLILRLMENFQLSFEVERNKTYLIPELMETEEIELKDINFNDETCLTFQYEYEFLPAGVMTRFIVKAHSYLLNRSGNNKACWKKGAYLQYRGSMGKVRLFDNVSNKRIEIHIAGRNKRQNRELLQRIRYYFDEIHNSINKLKLTEKIQCNCNIGCEHKYDYKMLLRYEEYAYEEAVCEKSMMKISVTSLLDGIESFKERQKERNVFMDGTPHIIFNNSIHNNNHSDNKSSSENSNYNDNENRNKNENTTTISIEIRNTIDALQGDLQYMKEEVCAEQPELVIEFEKLEQGLNKLNSVESKEEIVRSGALGRFNRFMQELQDDNSLLGKTIRNFRHGVSIAQDVADKYNSIAEWCGMPIVPKLFLKK